MTISDDCDGISIIRITVTTVTERQVDMKNVQIAESLFISLVRFHLLEETEELPKIEKGLMDKLDALEKRRLYTQYKTASADAEKENARKKYINSQGIPNKFQW